MINANNKILNGKFDFEKIKHLLSIESKDDFDLLLNTAQSVRNKKIGNLVYLRGLVEYSDICSKNCYYCGIRAGNTNIVRYTINDDEVVDAAKYVADNGYGSMVLQSGERSDKEFISKISSLITKIHNATENKIRITLSFGEQTEETYKKWFDLGAKRYLLRIESSNHELYKKLHPADHSYQKRVDAINRLIRIGFQTGTGVMIGVPFQTIDDLANDLLFIYNSKVAMVGMGPYIEHTQTPLYKFRDQLLPTQKRIELTLKMIAILRLMRPTINIASTTALQTLAPEGQKLGLIAGANVIMPNITPSIYKVEYNLYEGKPNLNDQPEETNSKIEKLVHDAGCKIAWNEWGDSNFYKNTNKKSLL